MLRRILRRRVLGYTALPMLVVLVATYSLLTRGALTTGAEPGPTATSTRVAIATASATTTPATLATATPSPSPSPTATATLAPSPTPTMTPTPPPVPPFQIAEPSLTILEAPCGAVVYAKDPHARLAPASLTKIVTALTAIDHVKLNDRVVSDVSAKALAAKTHSSVMGLEPGMVVTVEDLLYGLFLPSGNDAAIQLAEKVSGSVDAFVQLMNQEAAAWA